MGDVTQKRAHLISCVRFSRIISDLAGEFEDRCYANGKGSAPCQEKEHLEATDFPC